MVEDTATVGRTGAVPGPTARGVAAHGAGVYCDEVKIDGYAAALTRTATAAVAAGAAHGEIAAHSASVQRRVATAVGNAATITSSRAAAGAARRRVRIDGARGQRQLVVIENAAAAAVCVAAPGGVVAADLRADDPQRAFVVNTPAIRVMASVRLDRVVVDGGIRHVHRAGAIVNTPAPPVVAGSGDRVAGDETVVHG